MSQGVPEEEKREEEREGGRKKRKEEKKGDPGLAPTSDEQHQQRQTIRTQRRPVETGDSTAARQKPRGKVLYRPVDVQPPASNLQPPSHWYNCYRQAGE